MVRANAIKDWRLVGYLRRLADVLIEPATQDVHWADFGAYERCIAAGDAATERSLPQLRHLLRHERLWSVLRQNDSKRLAEAHLESGELALSVE